MATKIIPSPVDTRDHLYQATGKIINLPASVDLRVFDRDGVNNQGSTNTCTFNAATSAIEITLSRAGQFRNLSRLFGYYVGKAKYGTENQDNGFYARDVMKTISEYGLCDEDSWPFDPSKIGVKPPQSCYDEAKKLAGGEYCAIVVDNQNMQCALAEGYPIIFAADIGDSWNGVHGNTLEETADYIAANCMKRPVRTSSHEMLLVGYRMYNGKLHYILENSWGNWGCGGFALVPWDWAFGYGGDFWIMRNIPNVLLPVLWTPQLEGQKPAPIVPVKPPKPPKHKWKCKVKMKFGLPCSCGAVK